MLQFVKNHKAEIQGFTAFVRGKARELRDVINAYEEKSGKSCGTGDDGFSDLCYHIVGLGETVYNATIARPQLAINRAQKNNYEESFAYVLHFDDLAESIDPQRYVNWAAKEIKHLAAYAETTTSNERQTILARLNDAMHQIASGNFDVKPWLIKDYYKVYANAIGSDKDGCYSIPNLLLDLTEYAQFFSKEALAALKPVKTPKFETLNREKAVSALNQDFLHQLRYNAEARELVLRKGFTPFASRSNDSLRKALKDRNLTT